MNFDETLAFVAADMIWRYAVEEGKIQPIAHRGREFPFVLMEVDYGLTEHKYFWTPNSDRELVRAGHPAQARHVRPLPPCVCPPWTECTCEPDK